ncbi:ATP-binding protein [Bacillus sp. SJS]|uniref:ATP-binding protein n=1 Tax=Bacillus sp. SJS TaxID=1423321 RepID=UPI00068C6C38|nr:DUF87 domain-containing protein [Bacillus sp. SJS]KZZ84377.1 hypothetical protein AS29_010985 [Bacillus sp. SJS]
MIHYIDEIITILEEKIDFNNNNNSYLFRLDNFLHPKIYLEVSSYFKKKSSEQGVRFKAKLAKEQWKNFKDQEEYIVYLDKLEQEDFVEQEAQMTTWRNSIADQKGILFLMGTENVQDKGGLADFYKVSPEIIERKIGKKYANWFEKMIELDDQYEVNAVNHFFDHLFRVIPKDLYKLSSVIDRLETKNLFGINEVLGEIGYNFVEDWGLPTFYELDNKTITQLSKKGKFDLLEKSYKFKSRAEFKDGLTKAKFSKLEKRIKEFKGNEKFEEFGKQIEDVNKMFGSFDNFENALTDYFKGINLDTLRPMLFQLDFNLINAIVNFKIAKTGSSKKDTITKIYGSPIEAFSKMIFSSLMTLENLGEQEKKPLLTITLNEAVLSNYLEDNIYDLYNAWSKICFATGGLLEYLQEELEEYITVRYKSNEDPFQISYSDNLSIKPTKGTQTLSYIHISVQIQDSDRQMEYKWVFNPNDHWLNTFDINLLDQLLDQCETSTGFLPIFSNVSLGNLLSSVDSEIFFHQLSGSRQDFCNVFELFPMELQEGSITTRLYQLSSPFKEFIKDLKKYGFYNTVNARKSRSALLFIEKYTNVLESLVENYSSIDTVERKYIYLVTNLFLMVQSKDVAKEEYLKGAIVPPIHPAMLEKMIEQQAFYRQGLNTLLIELVNGNPNCQFEKMIDNIARQSTIITGLDTIVSESSTNRLTKEVFGYYGLHGEVLEEESLESMALLDNDLIFDEDFNTKEMLTNSFMSRLIEQKLMEYVQTFPAQSDSIKIGFVNFDHLQPVVAGVHGFIEKLKDLSHPTIIKLQIISPSHLQEGRTYVNFWLDNFFEEEDNVSIETYYRSINLRTGNSSILKEVILEHDLIFTNNVMSTGRISNRHTGEANITPSDTRFPMVFHPMPIYGAESGRAVSISQRQFQAAFIHSQLSHRIENPDSKDGIYRVEKELFMSDQMKTVLDILHDKARWVVSLDTGLDRKFFGQDKVISFSTGEGPYGELNMTISASSKVREDVINKLTKRLKNIFPSWDKEKLFACAQFCIDQSKNLDGIKILKSLNPYDYEVHSFLSYILSAKSLNINTQEPNLLLKAYIPLDSYMHWFVDTPNRPDYLLIEINKEGINSEIIDINATVIECKMGKENNQQIEKGMKQLSNCVSYLADIFYGSSRVFNRRYWFAQLYRALVFSPNFVSAKEEDQISFNKNLLKILDGKFKINWSAKLLTYWLDYNEEKISEKEIQLEGSSVPCIHEAFGQIYIQKNLLPNEMLENITFEAVGKNLRVFANNKQDFELLINEFETEVVDSEEVTLVEVDKQEANSPLEKHEKSGAEVDNSQESTFNGNRNMISQVKHSNDLEKEERNKFNNPTPLEKVRILLGKDTITQKDIYWEYGHPQLENRHILISGKSGVGKTYFIQCLLYELARNGISSIVFDYTDGFKKSKLEPEFKEALSDDIEQFLVFRDKFPVNPFKRNLKELDEDEFLPESDEDVAERIKSVFSAVYKDIGSQQANALYQATKEGLKKYGDAMDLNLLGVELEALGTSYALTTLSKIQSIIDRNPFNTTSSYNWDEHLEKKGKVFIVQLTGFNRDVQLVITEFILWDLWNYLLTHGDKVKPFPAIIDEAQNLDHSEKSPSAKILTEGRKFGWSGWYATQFMQGQLGKDEIQRLQNSSQKIYFSPPEEEITNIASYLDTDSHKRKEWAKRLSGLRKGQCVVWGPILNTEGNLERKGPRIVDVSPFSRRVKEE